jgi:hypothetical protein
MLLKGSKGSLQSNTKYIHIAAYRNKEESIVSENYESTREQKKTSTVYEYNKTQKNKVLVRYQQSPRDSSIDNVKAVVIVLEKMYQ